MTIQYSKTLRGYVVTNTKRIGKIATRAMIACKETRAEALAVGLQRLAYIKQ